MAWYRCRIRGENFPLVKHGELRLFGFHATRFVEAANAQEAEDNAARAILADADLASPMGAPGADRASLAFEEVLLVDAPGAPNRGFTFYLMEDG